MKLRKYIIGLSATLLLGMTSCVGDLNLKPDDPNQKLTLDSAEEYLALLARAYAGLESMEGLDLDDGGMGVYIRQLFNQQELPTDEAFISGNWDDAGVDEMGFGIPGPNNHWCYEMYTRVYYQIALCNEFLRQIEKADDFFTQDEITEMKAEAHVLRDLSYYHLIDIFGKGPWVDEDSPIGATPETYSRVDLYNKTVEDLLQWIPLTNPATQQEYGRVSREGGLALLAKLYLNAGVYTGTPAWQECANTCQEILKTVDYLAPTYKYLFCATNDEYVACKEHPVGEILWVVPQEANTMESWGGTTYLAVGAYNANYDLSIYGLASNDVAWNGPHMRPETTRNFPESATDGRYLFLEGDFDEDLEDISTWVPADADGFMCIKWVYTGRDDYYNETGKYTTTQQLCPTDFPVFRVADIYLMLTECELNGVSCNGLNYYNKVRQRAGISSVGSLPSKEELLNERNRELYWECHRRSDLIRFGKYTGSAYNWQWKGGVQQGTALPEYRKLMPIPIQYTPTVGQNDGY